MLMHQLVPELFLGTLPDHGQYQRAVLRDRAFKRAKLEEKFLRRNELFTTRTRMTSLRKFDIALTVQDQQQVPTSPVLEPTIGLFLVPVPAQGPGDL